MEPIGQLFPWVERLGVPTVLVLVMLYYQLRENANYRRDAESFQKRQLDILEKHIVVLGDQLIAQTKILIEHDTKTSAFIQTMNEANRYQREEHRAIVDEISKMSDTVKEVELRLVEFKSHKG